jgi:hypothetical protein
MNKLIINDERLRSLIGINRKIFYSFHQVVFEIQEISYQ